MSARRLLSLAVISVVSIAFVISTQVARAQEVTATIVGTITDPSGAPIRGASVVATDANRGTVWTAKTNDSGSYSLQRLPIGSYSVKVAATGFDTALRPPFVLQINQTARVDVTMKVGQVSESVEVTSEAPVLQTDERPTGHGYRFCDYRQSSARNPQLRAVDIAFSGRYLSRSIQHE